MSAAEETKESAEVADMSELLLAPHDPDQPAADDAAPVPADTDEQISDAPLVYESQTIEINGVRHEIINQCQDETGQPVVVLKNEETGEHVILPLSALVGESADGTLPGDPAAAVLPDATDESQTQNESRGGEDAAVSQPDGAVLSCVSSAPDDSHSVQAPDEESHPVTAAATIPDTAAGEMAVDQLQTLADQAGVEQQLLQIQQPVHQPEVNGINGDIAEEAVLRAVQVADPSAVNQITFDPSTVIDANGANGSSLEALVAGATVVAGEDGNQFVIIPSEDGSTAGQQIHLADVIGEGDGSGQTYLIQTEDGLVACSAAPEVVEKVPASPIDQIASNEQAILEAVLASGNFSNGQVIHAVSGDQTMAYTVQISSEGAALIPIGPVLNNAPATPKKILGKSRSQGESVMAGNRSLTSAAAAQRANQAQARKNQSNVQFANSRQVTPANRSQATTASKLPASNQVTVTRINPPSRSSQQSSTASSSLSSDVSLLTAVTGPSQLSSSRRTYSKKNILWVNPESSTKSASSSDSAGNDKSAVVPALVSTNSNMTVSATTVTSSPVAEKAVSPVAKKQNPILTSRSSSKPLSPPKQHAKEEVPVREEEKRKETKSLPKSSLSEPIKKTTDKSAQQQQKAQAESPVAKKTSDESLVTRKSESTPKKKEPESRAPESEPTRRSNRASKRVTKLDEEVTPVPEVKEPETEILITPETPAEESASQKDVVAEPIGKRGGRRSTSTEKREEPAPQPPKSTRTRNRASKALVEPEATSIEVIEQKEEQKAVEVVPVSEAPAAAFAQAEPEAAPTPTPTKSSGRKGRKAAEKLPDQVDSGEKSVSESESAAPETPADTDSASKTTGSVRRSGRASKRKVEEDFVSEIEPEALGERPARKSRTETASPEKDVKHAKDPKEKEKEKAVKIVSEAAQPESVLTNSHVESAVEDVVIPVAEKKDIIAVTPKKRVGFREALDDVSPPSSSKRVKIAAEDVRHQKSVDPASCLHRNKTYSYPEAVERNAKRPTTGDSDCLQLHAVRQRRRLPPAQTVNFQHHGEEESCRSL